MKKYYTIARGKEKMVKYCSECGNKLKESFKMSKYCPECGSKLEENFKFCPECGKKLISKFTFCPECNKKMLMLKDAKRLEKIETKKEVKTKAKEKTRFTLPKISLKISKKTAIAIISIVCVAVVVAAAILVISPFGNGTAGVKSAGGRTFIVTVESTYGSDVDCYITIDNLKQGEYGNTGFVVNSSGTEILTINEDDLKYERDAYKIVLYATVDDSEEFATALAVTESAEFLISSANGQHSVECTSSQ